MSIWELLGIAPTEDISKIKSAYARQAKQFHPEEHPEEFKALQSAYKAALQVAKSRKAGKGAAFGNAFGQERKPERDAENFGRVPDSQRDIESHGPEPQRDIESRVPEPERDVESHRPQRDIESFGPEPNMGTSGQEPGTARDFDFSAVDSYGERAHFLSQFLLLSKNPCLKNRTEAWDYFLNRNAFADLFADTAFRKEFVRTLCGVYGWRRKTILYFERFLSSFHTGENKPSDGEWETDLRVFRKNKRIRFRLPFFCMDRFWLKEGRSFYGQLRKKVCQEAGREIDLDVKLDLIRYMEFYLAYGKEMAAYIDRLYVGWRFEQILISCFAAAACLVILLSGVSIVRKGQNKEAGMSYLMELYELDPENCPEEEQKRVYQEYHDYWKYAEDAIDDVLERYAEWETE